MLIYRKGDATSPHGDGGKVIVHCVNDAGGWGCGFVVAVSKRWTTPEYAYRQWFRSKTPPDRLFDDGKVLTSGDFKLGEVQFVRVGPALWVANIIGQCGYISHPDYDGGPPIRYEAIESGLQKVREFAVARGLTVHGPRLGAGLAGGEWPKIENLLTSQLDDLGVDVTIYDLPR